MRWLMSEAPVVDLDACAREPIHVPGSIQPHGVMLVADRTTQEITHAAGEATRVLGVEGCVGRTLGAVLGDVLAERLARSPSPASSAATRATWPALAAPSTSRATWKASV